MLDVNVHTYLPEMKSNRRDCIKSKMIYSFSPKANNKKISVGIEDMQNQIYKGN